MKARLTDPKCMHLRWRKAIFDNPFTRLKYILCSPLLSLINFSWKITLARITPYTGGQVPKILNDWKCPNNSWGHEKSSMIESAQTILVGIKENSQSSKVPIQSWGAWRKIQRIQKFWAKTKQMQWCSKSNEKKNKEKEPKPNAGGHRGPFYKSNSKVHKCMKN